MNALPLWAAEVIKGCNIKNWSPDLDLGQLGAILYTHFVVLLCHKCCAGKPCEYNTLHCQKLSHCTTSSLLSVGLSSFKFLWWAPIMHVFSNRVHKGLSRSSKVVDFGTNRNGVCDFLLVINSNLGHIMPRFRNIADFLLKTAPHPNSILLILGCSQWSKLPMLGI